MSKGLLIGLGVVVVLVLAGLGLVGRYNDLVEELYTRRRPS